MTTSKKILVTGGAGFVGSHLCERLVSLGHNVTSLDNYFTGSRDNHVDGVNYVMGGTQDIYYLFYEDTFDYIYHLGEYSRVEQSYDDMSIVWLFNKVGTYEVIRYAKKINAKLIYSGSSTKFADNTPGYEQSPYTWSKATNTEFLKQYADWYGLDYAITYFYNVYGPREITNGKYATLIGIYAEAMRNDMVLPVVLPGTQKRNFTHIDDIVDALILIGENGKGDEYGIGHPDSYSVLDVAELFGGKIKHLPERKGNRMSAQVLTDKTRALGWSPKRNLPDYIKGLDL